MRNRQEATCRVMGKKDQRQAAEGTAASPHTSNPVNTAQLPCGCRTLGLTVAGMEARAASPTYSSLRKRKHGCTVAHHVGL